MAVGDGVPDAVGLSLSGQLAHQLQRKGNGTAQTVAGGDIAVHDDLGIQHLGTGQLILKTGVCRGLSAFQQAQLCQHAAQMAATFLPACAKETQVSVTVLLAARFGVPGMPPGSTTMSTSE